MAHCWMCWLDTYSAARTSTRSARRVGIKGTNLPELRPRWTRPLRTPLSQVLSSKLQYSIQSRRGTMAQITMAVSRHCQSSMFTVLCTSNLLPVSNQRLAHLLLSCIRVENPVHCSTTSASCFPFHCDVFGVQDMHHCDTVDECLTSKGRVHAPVSCCVSAPSAGLIRTRTFKCSASSFHHKVKIKGP